MTSLGSGQKKKLNITRCSVSNGIISPSRADADIFEVMLNPSDFTHLHSISYTGNDGKGGSSGKSARQALGRPSVESKFNVYNPETVAFSLMVDGTGVVASSSKSGGNPDVKAQVRKLKDVVYKYVGSDHQPSIVRILWGDFIFDGRLDSLAVEYTLFKPSGEPLRAKVKISFTSYVSDAEGALKANRSSPDLTHVVVVKAGDTLPLLCYRIYKDCSYYIEIARVNGLINFRNIKPGSRLYFPPLR